MYLICSVSNEQQVKKQEGKTSGFLAPLPLSDALVKFIGTGENELSRSDVVKRMWEYIKQKGLQVLIFHTFYLSLKNHPTGC